MRKKKNIHNFSENIYFFYQKHFQRVNALAATFFVRNVFIHIIFCTKIFYPHNFFFVWKCIIRNIFQRKYFIRGIFYKEIFYPQHCQWVNLKSALFSGRTYFTRDIFRMGKILSQRIRPYPKNKLFIRDYFPKKIFIQSLVFEKNFILNNFSKCFICNLWTKMFISAKNSKKFYYPKTSF